MGGVEPLIQLRDIVKHYRRVRALNGVSVDFPPGITGLLGPNGAGKSTLIKIILGLVRATSGDGTVMGYRLRGEERQIRSLIGYVPEDDCYIAGLTGVEMVQFAATLSGFEPTEALRRAHEILDFCNVEQERYRSVETYSTGMRQRIRFAAALVHDPPLLILDEPTSGLDPEERISTLSRIRLLAGDYKKSVILSTHILHDAQSTCDHVVIISEGQIKLADPLQHLQRSPTPVVFVRVAAESEPVIQALKELQLSVHLESDGAMRVDGEVEEIAPRIWEAVRRVDAVLLSMVPGRNSLEEIFMTAVQEAQHAHS